MTALTWESFRQRPRSAPPLLMAHRGASDDLPENTLAAFALALEQGADVLETDLRFSRDDESEADLVGLELAARAGYDPHAGVTLWQKMAEASKGAPPEFISTHPSGPTRIRDIEANIPKVQGLYERAPKPERRFEPPKMTKPTTPSRETSR